MILQPVLKAAEALLNRGIERSTTAESLCAGLQNRCLVLHIEPPGINVRVTALGGQLQIATSGDNADATITGTPLGMNRLLGPDPQAPIREGVVAIRGDGEVAEQFRELLRLARPDLEEELSRIIGDAAAHQFGNAVRNLTHWGDKAAHSFARSVSEYLREERRDLPTRTETNEFLAQVDALSNDLARAEARAARLRKRLRPRHPSGNRQ